MNASTTLQTHVGMDVHAATIDYAVRIGAEVVSGRIQHSPVAVRNLVRQLRKQLVGPLRACYEAGPTGFELYRILVAEGLDCVVIAPSLVPRRAGDRCKTDRRDARNLRELDEAGLLVPVHVPTREEEAARTLTRRLERARRAVARNKNEINSLLLRKSVQEPAAPRWSRAHRAWLAKVRLTQDVDQLVLDDCLLELAHGEQRQARIEQQVEDLAKTEPFREKVARLRCLKGIDTQTAMVIATELVAPERFRGPRQVMSYVGLAVSEYSSGQSQHRGGITRAGNEHLRLALVRAANHASRAVTKESSAMKTRRSEAEAWAAELGRRCERRLHDKYTRMVRHGKHRNVAVAAVARELAGWTWALLTYATRSQQQVRPVNIDTDGVLMEN